MECGKQNTSFIEAINGTLMTKYGHIRLGPLKVTYNKKSLYKAVSWRILSMSLAQTINYIFLDDLKQATMLTLIGATFSTFMYYGHERLWAVVRRNKWLNI